MQPVFTHDIQVLYSHCDMQQVVHNSWFLRWCDDIADVWFRSLGGEFAGGDWDVMVKRAEVVWDAPARLGDTIRISLGVTRWGSTSFDVGFTGQIGGATVFSATMTYVGVERHTTTTMPTPHWFRDRVGEP